MRMRLNLLLGLHREIFPELAVIETQALLPLPKISGVTLLGKGSLTPRMAASTDVLEDQTLCMEELTCKHLAQDTALGMRGRSNLEMGSQGIDPPLTPEAMKNIKQIQLSFSGVPQMGW